MTEKILSNNEKLWGVLINLYDNQERLNHLLTTIYETKGKELKVFKYLTEEIFKLKLELDKLKTLVLQNGEHNG